MPPISPMHFAELCIRLKRKPIRFDDRPYLATIYNNPMRRLVIRASRQVEKTQLVVNTILRAAVIRPGTRIVCVFPRLEQARQFSNSRMLPTLEESPLLRRALVGRDGHRPQVMNMRFTNGSEVNLRAAYHSADAVRGLDADLLLVDEFQDIAPGDLPVLEECLSHSPLRRVILTGTPKLTENHLEAVFRQSTACEWRVPCPQCQHRAILDEQALGLQGPICPKCRGPIDPRIGEWTSRNPGSTWGAGFWVNHLMVPWVHYGELLERQRSYDAARFRNEVLGMPTALGDHIVTLEELEACCANRPMAASLKDVPPEARNALIAGLDWGGGAVSRTVLVIGYMDEKYVFHVCRFERFAAREDPKVVVKRVGELCQKFKVRAIGADGNGNGHVYNRLLYGSFRPVPALFALFYAGTDQQPVQNGALWRWSVNRSGTIGALFGRVKKETIVFPRSADCGSFLDEIACEVTEYDEANRSLRFSHPANQPDDALHALNYALHVAVYLTR